MNIRIDKSGRIALPKSFRQRLGLKPGATVELKVVANGILLCPVSNRPSLVKRDGFLVHTGRVARTLNWRQFSHELEDNYLAHILGQ